MLGDMLYLTLPYLKIYDLISLSRVCKNYKQAVPHTLFHSNRIDSMYTAMLIDPENTLAWTQQQLDNALIVANYYNVKWLPKDDIELPHETNMGIIQVLKQRGANPEARNGLSRIVKGLYSYVKFDVICQNEKSDRDDDYYSYPKWRDSSMYVLEAKLRRCSELYDSDYVQLVLEQGLSPNSYFHMTYENLIITATGYNKIDTVKLLLKYGACPNQHEEYGTTAIDVAKDKGYDEIAKVLYEYEYKIYHLKKAICNNKPWLVEKLLSSGHDPNLHQTSDMDYSIETFIRWISDKSIDIQTQLFSCDRLKLPKDTNNYLYLLPEPIRKLATQRIVE